MTKEINGVANTEVDLRDKWVATISTQKGCPQKCKFCDVPKFGFFGNVSVDELAYQIETIIKNEEVKETDDIDIDIERFLNGESVTFDKENQPETEKPDTFVTIDFAECKFDIDFTDSLNDKVQYEESFSELMESVNNEETKDLAYDELYKRAINYAHERFSGYINRVAMSYMAIDKLFEQLGFRKADLSHENTS